MSAESAHSIFRLRPARMSARARADSIETCSSGQQMPYTWRPAGRDGGLGDLSARWRATCRTMYIAFLSSPSAVQRQSRRGEREGCRAARADADVARKERKTEGEEVELTAITLYLHLACFELRRGRRALGASPSPANLTKAPVVRRHVYASLSRCLTGVGLGEMGLVHCSRQGEDGGVGADAPRPPPAGIRLPKF